MCACVCVPATVRHVGQVEADSRDVLHHIGNFFGIAGSEDLRFLQTWAAPQLPVTEGDAVNAIRAMEAIQSGMHHRWSLMMARQRHSCYSNAFFFWIVGKTMSPALQTLKPSSLNPKPIRAPAIFAISRSQVGILRLASLRRWCACQARRQGVRN